jgi:hypothetical protein
VFGRCRRPRESGRGRGPVSSGAVRRWMAPAPSAAAYVDAGRCQAEPTTPNLLDSHLSPKAADPTWTPPVVDRLNNFRRCSHARARCTGSRPSRSSRSSPSTFAHLSARPVSKTESPRLCAPRATRVLARYATASAVLQVGVCATN